MVAIFLIVPTITVIVSAVVDDGRFSLDRVAALFSETALSALGKSVLLSASTAVARRGARRAAGVADRQPQPRRR